MRNITVIISSKNTILAYKLLKDSDLDLNGLTLEFNIGYFTALNRGTADKISIYVTKKKSSVFDLKKLLKKKPWFKINPKGDYYMNAGDICTMDISYDLLKARF